MAYDKRWVGRDYGLWEKLKHFCKRMCLEQVCLYVVYRNTDVCDKIISYTHITGGRVSSLFLLQIVA